jgi:hypothetical protein
MLGAPGVERSQRLNSCSQSHQMENTGKNARMMMMMNDDDDDE